MPVPDHFGLSQLGNPRMWLNHCWLYSNGVDPANILCICVARFRFGIAREYNQHIWQHLSRAWPCRLSNPHMLLNSWHLLCSNGVDPANSLCTFVALFHFDTVPEYTQRKTVVPRPPGTALRHKTRTFLVPPPGPLLSLMDIWCTAMTRS